MSNHVSPEAKKKKLTKRQQMVYDFIVHTIKEYGYPPTLREIGNHLEISSTNGVNDHLKALERKGFLRKGSLRARALTPLINGEEFHIAQASVSVPVLGRVAAGEPIPRIEDAKETIQMDRSLLGSAAAEDVFALRVQGQSMINDGILEGDCLFIRRQQDANNGDIVVAVVDDEATVKRFYREGDAVRLQPANDEMSPIVLGEDDHRDIEVIGIAIGLSRRFS